MIFFLTLCKLSILTMDRYKYLIKDASIIDGIQQ